MSKLSYKTLFIIFFFLLIGVIVLSKFVLPNQKVSATWWNDMWNYRKAISIGNSGVAQTNTQIKILDNYDLSALVTAGKLQADLDDLRFTDINGNLINYWIEDATNNSVDIWGIISSLPASGSTIYMYYGNPSAVSASSTSNITIGGTMTSVGGYRIHTFKGSGTLTNAKAENAEVLVVAGGGGGGSSSGGGGGGGAGGGAGGLTYNSAYSLTQGQIINITVGVGGTNGATSSNQSGTDGGTSIFGTITVNGGGGGANVGVNGRPGGSGGGGGYNGYTTVHYGGSGVVGIGNSGGNTTDLASAAGAGGGGAGGIGGNNKTGHVGGDAGLGINYSITGVGITYASGGRGGGGSGAVNKTANTGNGGDGSYASAVATSGASGIVVVRYLSGASATPATEEIGTAPIAYWKFDEGIGTTAYDSTSNQNNGTISGATWTDESQCVSEKCLDFNNSSKITINDNSILKPTNVTVSVWVYPKTQNGNYKGIVSKGDNSVGYEIRTTSYTSSTTDIQFRLNGDLGSPSQISINNNQWAYLVGTYDGSTTKFYLNGILKSQKNYSTPISYSPTYNLNIGKLAYAELYFNGFIDEPKIYPYARTAAQIKLDYNSRGSSKGSSANLGVKSNTAPSLKSKLVAYYKFDEGGGTITYNSTSIGSSINANFATGNSAPTWSNDGKYNKSLNFNNINSYASFYTATFNGSSQFTASAWVKSNDTSQNQTILSANGPFFLRISGGKFRVGILTITPGIWTFVNGTIPLSNNTWYHLSLVYDGSTMKSYVNGKLDTNNNKSSGLTNFNTIYIGYPVPGGEQYPFNGLIDEVKIYNSALTADEIKLDYNRGSAIQMGATNQTIGTTTTSLEYCIPGDPSACSGPVAEWNFEESTGTTTKDTSGNNNTGTFGTGNSAPTWTIGKKNTGSGIKFNGESASSYISTSYPSTGPTSYTAEAWIKPNSISGSGEHSTYGYTIVAASVDGSRYPVWITVRNGEIKTYAFSTTQETVGANILANQWYHITVSATQNSTATIYVNGIGKTSFTAGSGAWDITDKLVIGDLRPSRNISFNGSIDGVKIYNYARTPAQVAYDYNKGAPIAWWKLDECQGNVVNDSSGVGNTGVIVIGSSGTQNSLGTCQIGTSAAWTNGANGHTNSSLNFDGVDDYVNIANNSSFHPTNEVSISSWIYPISKSGYQGIAGAYTANSYELFLYDNTVRWDIYNTTSRDLWNSNITVPWNTWSHIVATYQSTTGLMTIYINGVKKAQHTHDGGAAPIKSSTSSFLIGWSGNSTEYFNGQIDDVRIYNYALTSEQVKVLYNGGGVSFN